jgi:hypothetical protein
VVITTFKTSNEIIILLFHYFIIKEKLIIINALQLIIIRISRVNFLLNSDSVDKKSSEFNKKTLFFIKLSL